MNRPFTETERAAVLVIVADYFRGVKPGDEAERIRRNMHKFSQRYAEELAGVAVALDALPADMPSLEDAIAALYACQNEE